MPSPKRHLSVDELSQRASTGLAIRRGEIKISDPIPSSYVHNGPEMDYDAVFEQSTPRMEGTLCRRSGAGTLHGRNESGTRQTHISRFTERTSLGPSPSTSNMSSTLSNSSPMQRRGTGLRATLKRMFSKQDKHAVLQKRSAYENDPGHVFVSDGSHSEHSQRPLALHFSTISPSSALHSHAVSPHLRAESADNTPQASSFGQLGIRRNTVPSLLTVQEQSEALTVNVHNPETVQRPSTAIRRDNPQHPLLKRRSRSADALTQLLRSPKPNTSDRQDRAGEIAYWRNSVLDNPLATLGDVAPTPSVSSPEPTVRHDLSPSIEPVQDFDFGLNQDANSARPATLHERVNTLEVKLFDFEYALANLQGNDITKPNLPKRPSRRRSLRDLFDETDSATESSSTNDLSHLSTPTDGWQSPSPGVQQRVDRTSKATTVKAVHRQSPPQSLQYSSPPSIHFTSEQYDTLFDLIQDEKAARQNLEVQVLNLQKEVNVLRSPVCSHVGPAKYPTPSPDSFRNHMVMPANSRLLHHSPHLRKQCDLKETSRFSMTETESETDVDDRFPEIYETPQETSFRFEPRMVSPIQGNMI